MLQDIRQKIFSVINQYKHTQVSGLKDIEKQLELFTDDCQWMGFASPELVHDSGIQIALNKQAIRKLFQNYNNYIESTENVMINYFNPTIDEQNISCCFNMRIEVKKDPAKIIYFFNTLQFHLNSEFLIRKAFNWHGYIGNKIEIVNKLDL